MDRADSLCTNAESFQTDLRQRPSESRMSLVFAAASSIFAALLGAVVGGWMAFNVVEATAADERASVTRSSRADAYEGLLNAAADAQVVVGELLACIPPGHYTGMASALPGTPGPSEWTFVSTEQQSPGRQRFKYGLDSVLWRAAIDKCSEFLNAYAHALLSVEKAYNGVLQWGSELAVSRGGALLDAFPTFECWGGACAIHVILSTEVVGALTRAQRIVNVTVPYGKFSKSGAIGDAIEEVSLHYRTDPLRVQQLFYEVTGREFRVTSCYDVLPDSRSCEQTR